MPTNDSPLLPGFPHRLGRPRRTWAARFKQEQADLRRKQLWELRELFRPWIDGSDLEPTAAGANSRCRVFSLEVVFFAFLYQLLARIACAGAVKRVQSWRLHRGLPCPTSDTGAYCRARCRLPQAVLNKTLDTTAERVEAGSERWHGRRVRVVDGTGLSMPDTEANQGVWPQNSNMAPGCGFPSLKMVGLFDLFSGAWLKWAAGNKYDSENGLWRSLWGCLSMGDVVLGDCLYATYALVGGLQARGVDGVYALGRHRRIDWRAGKRLGKRDRLQTWKRTRHRPPYMSPSEWAQMPETLVVRVLQNTVEIPGFRPERITLVTTLVDAEAFPARDLFALYRRRWSVELYFRDIKIALDMDILGSRTPAQIRKELTMYAICYNLLRGLIQQAANRAGVDLSRISFQGAAEQLDQWSWLFMITADSAARRHELLLEFYDALVSSLVPYRPDRSEPRVRKRRPKNCRKMTRPRHAKPEPENAA